MPGEGTAADPDSDHARKTLEIYERIIEVETRPDGLRVQFDSSWGAGELQSHLLGRFNVDNLALSLAAG